MDSLTSLDRLTSIVQDRETLVWEGLFQRLPVPALKSGCPDLGRRYREGVEYFHLVSSIPDEVIQVAEHNVPATQTVSNKKKVLRRLLPSCADSD
jgi:hypothetical protein